MNQRLSAFETYNTYLAVKSHFNQPNYDFFRYRGKVKVSKDTFATRRDRFQFQKASRMYEPDEMASLFVCCFIKGKTWIGDMIDEEAHSDFVDYKRRRQALTYTFTSDLDKLFSEHHPSELFRSKKGSFPPILTYIISGTVSPETVSILNHFIGFTQNFDDVFSKQKLIVEKYIAFIEFDKKKMKAILKEKILQYGTQ